MPKKNSFSGEELLVLTNYLQSPMIDESEAIENALEAVALLDGETRAIQRSVKEVEVFCSSESGTRSEVPLLDTMAYVVNFADDAGFAIISHSTRTPTVFAMSDKGNLSPADSVDHPGLKVFFERLPQYYRMQLAQADSLEHALLDGVLDKLVVDSGSTAKESVGMRVLPGAGIIGGEGRQVVYGRWYAKNKIEPKLTTHWHQYDPYNQDTPMVGTDHTLVGCIAVAIGQIMAYHQWPQYCWDEIDESSDRNLAISKLLHQIGERVNMNYGLSSSNANSSYAPSCFAHYDYEVGYLLTYSMSEIHHSLQTGMPLYARGRSSNAGHAWVIDGDISLERTVRIFEDGWEIERRTENGWLVHCNWGWRNSSKDGYYQSGIFNANDGAGPYTNYVDFSGTRSDDLYFRTNLQVIPYIHPKQNLQ